MKVVEFCQVAAGPYCGMLLADLGAEVIKVEPLGGDSLRDWPPRDDGFSDNFASLNRNKRSIALDLKTAEDREVARRLVARADVLIENNRPGVMARLGLGYDALKDRQPSLIYCSLSAYGQEGPRAAQGGFDLTLQAVSGIMSVTGERGGAPVKCGVPVSDFATGLYGAFAIASLLARVRAGGPGGQIDVSMLGSSLGIAALQTSEYFGSGRNPEALGAAHPRNAPYEAFRAVDGQFVLAAGNDKLWARVCEVLGVPQLSSEPRFATTTARAANQSELRALLEPMFRARTVEDLLEAFEAAGVPCGRINSYADALADAQVSAMGWVQDLELPTGRTTRTLGPTIRIDGRLPPIRRAPPSLDGDRAEILAELTGIDLELGA